jgi:hypothetical protein
MSSLLLPHLKRGHHFIFDTCLTSIPTGVGAVYNIPIITPWTKSWLYCVHLMNEFKGLDFPDLVPPSLRGCEDDYGPGM